MAVRSYSAARVYFIQAGESGPIKIGVSDDPIARRRHLQTASHETLTLLNDMPGGKEEEERLHALFAPERVRGEWFAPCAELLALANHPSITINYRLHAMMDFRSRKPRPFARNISARESAQ